MVAGAVYKSKTCLNIWKGVNWRGGLAKFHHIIHHDE